ncbi:MAG: hypothetical protein U9N47_12185 [Thermodesulfobacteriota bacterium]|nr:hypothetical protein [Thermodesulfobacteriota bacterium]
MNSIRQVATGVDVARRLKICSLAVSISLLRGQEIAENNNFTLKTLDSNSH